MRQEIVLFGGFNGDRNTYLDETWVWAGERWELRRPASAPQGRTRAGFAFDERRGRAVLFGGLNASRAFSDVWEWDGEQWVFIDAQTRPTARFGVAMTYDSVLGQTLLFGGVGQPGGPPLGDTWTWDGAAWQQLSPDTAPSPRHGSALAFDPDSERSILFGGFNGVFGVQDTWIFQGGTWSEPGSSVRSPDPRGTTCLGLRRPGATTRPLRWLSRAARRFRSGHVGVRWRRLEPRRQHRPGPT
ncbi:MAG: hypothetical protein HC923_12045, partial [Myxococcales bacterium]|nr:hypothetical protein [Myxococcales bacterium]